MSLALAPSGPALTGILLLAGGTILFTVNDAAIKFLSGDYALHEIILIRSLIGMAFLLVLLAHSRRGLAQIMTARPGSQLLRALVIVLSNALYYLGLANMEIADAAALAYISPLVVTALSVVVLGEKVGPRRWSAIGIGFLGVIVMLRPGAGMIQMAAILVLLSAILYALGNLLSRHMGASESALSLSFWAQAGFVVTSLAVWWVAGDGRYADEGTLWAFIVRPWFWPPLADWPLLALTGLSTSTGAVMVAQAYRTTAPGIISPFEYTGMPMAIVWGIAIFGTLPDIVSWAGIVLICGSGLFVAWREAQSGGPRTGTRKAARTKTGERRQP